MSNRQTRRHPVHPSLTPLYPSNERILDDIKKENVSSTHHPHKGNQNKKGISKRGRN